MKKLTTEEITEIMNIFTRFNSPFYSTYNDKKGIMKIGITALSTIEAEELIKAGYLFAVYSNICDEWNELSLTIHVFKRKK